jgi:dipeptidyl aminopeptidase/acylaminoacyl peptidase
LQVRQLLFAASALDNPADLFLVDLESGNERQLTYLNAEFLANRRLPNVEQLRFPSQDGVQIEGWVMKPTVGVALYPTVRPIHGGPYQGYGHLFSFEFHLLAGAGYAVLFVNHRGSTGYGDAFAILNGNELSANAFQNPTRQHRGQTGRLR